MTKLELMELAEECSDVLTAMEEDLLLNIAEYLAQGAEDIPSSVWKMQQLAALGKLDQKNLRTIAEYAGIAPDMAEIVITRAALKAVKEMDEGFSELVRDGIINGTAVPTDDSALYAAAMYSKQAADRLNKVNTVMRYFAKQQAMSAINRVTEILDKQQHLDILNKAAGKVIMGAESRQTAVRQCIKEMSQRGIPAFVDAAGRQWSPEAYVNMDIRTTCSNAAHEAQFTRMDDYGIDLIEVTSYPGARPKCAKDQGRIFDRKGKSKKYPSLRSSSYGEPDGLFGINCGHKFHPYVEGVSIQRYFPYDEKENDALYKKKQGQRRLERDVRNSKREVAMLKAAGDKEGTKLAMGRVKQKTAAYNEYCRKNGFKRKPDRLTVQGYRSRVENEKSQLNDFRTKMASAHNDWSKAVPQTHSKAVLDEITAFAKERGVKLYQIQSFDGDIDMLRQQINTIAKLKEEFDVKQKITLEFTTMLDDVFAETVNNTIRINKKAMRNAAITNFNLNSDRQLAATDFTGIVVHEMGHIISRIYGKKGLDIAKKAYYNIYNENVSIDDLLNYLLLNISEYATDKDILSKNNQYKEIIPEVLSKSKSTSTTEFVDEFIRIFKEECL